MALYLIFLLFSNSSLTSVLYITSLSLSLSLAHVSYFFSLELEWGEE